MIWVGKEWCHGACHSLCERAFKSDKRLIELYRIFETIEWESFQLPEECSSCSLLSVWTSEHILAEGSAHSARCVPGNERWELIKLYFCEGSSQLSSYHDWYLGQIPLEPAWTNWSGVISDTRKFTARKKMCVCVCVCVCGCVWVCVCVCNEDGKSEW